MPRTASRSPRSDALKKLARAERAYRRAQARAEQLRRERDEALRAALAAHSQTEAAEAMGVTRGRVGQLATRLQGRGGASANGA